MILDACRNNPFPVAGARRNVTRGLYRIEPGGNTLVVYAAKDGTTADDGAGRPHSPFTEALLKHIVTPGLEINFVFRGVRDDVVAATNRAQEPYVYGTLGKEQVYLSPPVPKPQPSEAAETARICRDVEGMSDISSLEMLANLSKGRPAARCIAARIELLKKQIPPSQVPGITLNMPPPKPPPRADRPRISVASVIFAEPDSQVPLSIEVGPLAEIPTNTFVRLQGLPFSVSLTVGQPTAPGAWAVPLSGLASLKAIVPAGVSGRSELVISLVAVDGTTLAKSRTVLAVAPPPQRPPVSKLGPLEKSRAERLLTLGHRQLEAGELSAARLIYERAADAGLAAAAMSLAATYDPAELARLPVKVSPDIQEARKWYGRARELGAPEAAERLARLAAPVSEKDRGRLPRVGEAFRDCTDCPEMVVVPAGSFMMGSPESEAGASDKRRRARSAG